MDVVKLTNVMTLGQLCHIMPDNAASLDFPYEPEQRYHFKLFCLINHLPAEAVSQRQ